MLWPAERKSATDGYRRLPENLGNNQVLTLDHSRTLLLPAGSAPERLDLKLEFDPLPLPEVETSAHVLGCYGTNIICHWQDRSGANQVFVSELSGAKFIPHGAFVLDSGETIRGFAYNPVRQLLAWTTASSPKSVFVANLKPPLRRVELKSDVASGWFIDFRPRIGGLGRKAAVFSGNNRTDSWTAR